METAQTHIDRQDAYQITVGYIQTAATMYRRGVEVWSDGFSWVAMIPRVTYTPDQGVTAVAVNGDTVVARGTVDNTVVTNGTTELYVVPSMTEL